jgi:hypothetical protein
MPPRKIAYYGDAASPGPGALVQGSDPLQAQAFKTQRPNQPEDIGQPLYDRVNYPAAGTSQLSFFSVPFGSISTLIVAGATVTTKVKGYRETNMDTGSVVPTKLFKLMGVSFGYIPVQQVFTNTSTATIGDDILRLKYGGFLEFRIVDKPILYLPMHFVPESNPIQCVATTISAPATVMASGIISALPFPLYKFGLPVTINPFENFRFLLNFDSSPALNQSFDIQVCLHSMMRRPS